MKPSKDNEALVDLLDVILRDGVILRADVIISVADIPLVGLKLSAALAGMETMTEYGLFEEWDIDRRQSAITRRQYGRSDGRRSSRPADSVDRREKSPGLGLRTRGARETESSETND